MVANVSRTTAASGVSPRMRRRCNDFMILVFFFVYDTTVNFCRVLNGCDTGWWAWFGFPPMASGTSPAKLTEVNPHTYDLLSVE